MEQFAIPDDVYGVLAGFDKLQVNFQLSSLFRHAWTFKTLSLVHPQGNLELRAGGTTNFHDLVPAGEETAPPDNESTLPPVIIQSLTIASGEIGYADLSRNEPFNTRIDDIDFQLENLSTLPEQQGALSFDARSESGIFLNWAGSVQLNPMAVEGRLDMGGGYLPLAYRYFGDLLNVRLDQGDLALALQHRISLANSELSAQVRDVNIDITDVSVSDKTTEKAILSLPRLKLTGLDLSWPERTVAADSITVSGTDLYLQRLADGSFNLQHLLVTDEPDGSAQEMPPATETVEESEATQPWTLTLDKAAIADLALTFVDSTLTSSSEAPAEIRVADIDLTAEKLSNAENAAMPITANIIPAEGGVIALAGSLTVLPALNVESTLKIDQLPLALSQPYVEEYTNLALNNGSLDVEGDLRVAPEESFSFSGGVVINNFSTNKKNSKYPLVDWQTLTLDQTTFSLSENSLAINRMTLEKPEVRIRISDDRSTNFKNLVKSPHEAETTQAAEEPAESTVPEGSSSEGNPPEGKPFRLTLGQIQVNDGTTDFMDRSLPIPFKTDITHLQGEVTGIDTASQAAASLTLEGQVAEYGLAKISGELAPSNVTEQADIKLLLRNVLMPDLNPYTIKFAGRKLASGRMNLDLRYRFEHGQLDADNNIVLTDVELGEKVPHPDALDLPLGLALALLKDSSGKIDIDLPVKGDASDPKFSIGGIVGRAFANLITKAVTAPFRLLGALVGASNEDFGKIEFEAGSSNITPPEREKLAKLAEALGKRPNLVLEVAGVFDDKSDREALKALKVDSAIKGARDDTDSPLDPESRGKILESLLRTALPETELDPIREPFKIPTNPETGAKAYFDQSAYNQALRKQLVAATVISDDELQNLGTTRAQQINMALVQNNGIAEQRLTLLPPEQANATKTGWIPLKLELTASKGTSQ